MVLTRWLGTAATLATLIAGCTSVQPVPLPLPVGTTVQRVAAKAAPDFSLPAIVGTGPVSLKAHEGKVRLVLFFATWCPHCQSETRALTKLQAAFAAKGFQTIGLSVDEDPQQALPPFAKTFALNYPAAAATADVQAAYGGIDSIPKAFLIDRQGRIVKTLVSDSTYEALARDVQGLL